jgi:hypothetical protein
MSLRLRGLSPHQEHRAEVKVEESLLAFSEAANIYHSLNLDAHALERSSVCNRGDNKAAVILEPDESTIEKVIDRRRQKQAIFAVEPFRIC